MNDHLSCIGRICSENEFILIRLNNQMDYVLIRLYTFLVVNTNFYFPCKFRVPVLPIRTAQHWFDRLKNGNLELDK